MPRVAAVLAIMLLSAPLAATRGQTAGPEGREDSVSAVSRDRSPAVATALASVVPGSGYAYAGEWRRAYPTFAATTGSIVMGAAVFQWDRCTFDWTTSCRPGVPTSNRLIGGALMVSGAALWMYQAWDAHRAVARRLARQRRAARLFVVPSGAAVAFGVSLVR